MDGIAKVTITGLLVSSRSVVALIKACMLMLCVLAFCFARPAHAKTPANTSVQNKVTVNWNAPGSSARQVRQVSASFVVSQRILLSLEWQDATSVAVPVGAEGWLTFKVVNEGNGDDEFVLDSLATAANPASGVPFVPSRCRAYEDDTRSIELTGGLPLAPGASRLVFVACQVPASAQEGGEGDVVLTVKSAVLSGVDKNECLSRDSNGIPLCDENDSTDFLWGVTGAEGGQAQATGTVASIKPLLNLVMDAEVVNASGQAAPVQAGNFIRYELTASRWLETGNTAYKALVSNDVSEFVTYQPGSLMVQSATGDQLFLANGNDDCPTDVEQLAQNQGCYDDQTRQLVVNLGDFASGDPLKKVRFTVQINSD